MKNRIIDLESSSTISTTKTTRLANSTYLVLSNLPRRVKCSHFAISIFKLEGDPTLFDCDQIGRRASAVTVQYIPPNVFA